ncbi:DUF5615 family PIN-like protein [Halotia branconii]|uniref:DUF5615 family PIN-like protein n=1 Tax=Halotia branconii TaxID=1620816 RepID=UPI003CCF4149
MARFYADEQFPFPAVELLRTLGHDVLTVQDAGNAYKETSCINIFLSHAKTQRRKEEAKNKDFCKKSKV